MRLSEICEIQSGYTARARLDPVESGGVPALQLRDIQRRGEFDPEDIPLYQLSGGFDRYWAGGGDVLFRSRGDQNTAVTIKPGTAKAAIAIQPLMILRPASELVDSGYLAWFINQPQTQRYFDSCARGTSMRMIPKPCIEDLDVILPDLETQRRIVEIDRLAQRERDLMHDLAEKRKSFISFALLEQARKTQPHGNGAGRSVARRQKPSGKSERTNS